LPRGQSTDAALGEPADVLGCVVGGGVGLLLGPAVGSGRESSQPETLGAGGSGSTKAPDRWLRTTNTPTAAMIRTTTRAMISNGPRPAPPLRCAAGRPEGGWLPGAGDRGSAVVSADQPTPSQ
jgi:hypothetical protein